MADELNLKRIIELQQKTSPEEGDSFAVDNANSGTSRITIQNLLDPTFSSNLKAAPAEATKEKIDEVMDVFAAGIDEAVDNWLDEHPEATTTVQDGSLTEPKFSEALKLKTIKDYVTPQMFGAVGDGETDDATAINNCIAFATANNKMVIFPVATYAVESEINISNSVIIDFGNSTIKYTGDSQINNVLKYGFSTTGAYKTHNGLYNLNIDANSNAKNGLHITGGKGIRLENVNIIKAVECALLIDESIGDVWEMVANKITASVSLGNTQGLTAIKITGSITDCYFGNIFAINGSESWIDTAANGCTFINVHGYSYPETFSVGCGIIVRGSGNFFINTIIDTFTEIGIQTLTPFNSFINTNFAKPAANTCIGFDDKTDYTVIDGVTCSIPITLVKSTTAQAITVKNITTYGQMVKDIDLTREKLPYYFTYDFSGHATTLIKSQIAQWQIVDTETFNITGGTLTSSPFCKRNNEIVRISLGVKCTDTSFKIRTGITLPFSQNVIAYNRTTGNPCLCSWWADGSINTIDTVAVNDVVYFDSMVIL